MGISSSSCSAVSVSNTFPICYCRPALVAAATAFFVLVVPSSSLSSSRSWPCSSSLSSSSFVVVAVLVPGVSLIAVSTPSPCRRFVVAIVWAQVLLVVEVVGLGSHRTVSSEYLEISLVEEKEMGKEKLTNDGLRDLTSVGLFCCIPHCTPLLRSPPPPGPLRCLQRHRRVVSYIVPLRVPVPVVPPPIDAVPSPSCGSLCLPSLSLSLRWSVGRWWVPVIGGSSLGVGLSHHRRISS